MYEIFKGTSCSFTNKLLKLHAETEAALSFICTSEDPLEEDGNPLQYSCLENPVDRGAWQVTVHGVAKSRTQLRN